MPNPLTQLAAGDKVSLSREDLNANFAARHSLGLTELTNADDGYVVLATDEAVFCTLGANMGIVLPDPTTCLGRSIYVAVTAAAGHTLSVTSDGSANINGSGTLALSTSWAGKRLVARAADWIAL